MYVAGLDSLGLSYSLGMAGCLNRMPLMLMELSESSPRMRGKPHRVPEHDALVRIIPAHAGQTHACYHPDRDRTDHPRACGANAPPTVDTQSSAGSSPRMRGKPSFTQIIVDEMRIIPAHAGQTRLMGSAMSKNADHPRACGANRYYC